MGAAHTELELINLGTVRLLARALAQAGSSMGSGGGAVLGVGTHTGDFGAIKAVNGDVTLGAVVGNITGLSGVTIIEGDVVPGEFTSVEIAVGEAILFNRYST